MEQASAAQPGTLTLAATPIGRAEDASPRLSRALQQAALIAAEDTRRLRRLAGELGVDLEDARVVSYFDGNERTRAPMLLGELQEGHDVLLLTDAGMPGVSDPGYRLVALCAQSGVPVTVIPGPSALTAALAVSGLPSDRFCFEGFPPRKGLARRLAELAAEPRTLVFFESPRRLQATLEAMAEAFGAERPAAVCRELTKTHEQVRRGTLAELADWAQHDVKGEVTLVVGGSTGPRQAPDAPTLAAAVAQAEAAGTDRKRAIAETARTWGIPKREVYDAVHRKNPE
jgi:16S rRNA (cytidine1402-2'-O)-methyltransferase